MRVNEIFYSIQGEGQNSGDAAVFIRFAGCNLECKWCDTNHAEEMSLTPVEIIKKIEAFPPKAMVVLTGGEPMMQARKELKQLLDCLVFRDKFIAMETNGTIYDIDIYKDLDWVTVSPKHDTIIHVPMKEICELKYVMEPVLTLGDIPDKKTFGRKIYLQPMSQNEQSTLRCIDWIQKFPDRFSLSVQLHKYLNLR